MDQGYDNPFHIICCFRKQPVSLSPSGSALKRVYWEWGGGVVGHQGYCGRLPGAVCVVSTGNLHLQKKPMFQDSMALKKGIGCKGAGRTGLSR